ncbi:MAG: FxsA family protein [Planctomycetota bacterium]
MLGRLLLVFILVPLLDLVLLLRIGHVLTFWPTLALVVVTGIVGATLARRQGLRTLARIQSELESGRLPTGELADGVLILLAGAVLVTPGFLTDLFGLALLVRPLRHVFRRVLTRHFKSRLVVNGFPGDAYRTEDNLTDSDDDDVPHAGSMKYVENEAQRR